METNLKVVNCCECDALATTDWDGWRKYRHLGLRIIGRWKVRKDGHRRPICRGCARPTLRQVPGPGEHRPLGQGVPIWREMRRI